MDYLHTGACSFPSSFFISKSSFRQGVKNISNVFWYDCNMRIYLIIPSIVNKKMSLSTTTMYINCGLLLMAFNMFGRRRAVRDRGLVRKQRQMNKCHVFFSWFLVTNHNALKKRKCSEFKEHFSRIRPKKLVKKGDKLSCAPLEKPNSSTLGQKI